MLRRRFVLIEVHLGDGLQVVDFALSKLSHGSNDRSLGLSQFSYRLLGLLAIEFVLPADRVEDLCLLHGLRVALTELDLHRVERLEDLLRSVGDPGLVSLGARLDLQVVDKSLQFLPLQLLHGVGEDLLDELQGEIVR